jgi:hypothetical protein
MPVGRVRASLSYEFASTNAQAASTFSVDRPSRKRRRSPGSCFTIHLELAFLQQSMNVIVVVFRPLASCTDTASGLIYMFKLLSNLHGVNVNATEARAK